MIENNTNIDVCTLKRENDVEEQHVHDDVALISTKTSEINKSEDLDSRNVDGKLFTSPK